MTDRQGITESISNPALRRCVDEVFQMTDRVRAKDGVSADHLAVAIGVCGAVKAVAADYQMRIDAAQPTP